MLNFAARNPIAVSRVWQVSVEIARVCITHMTTIVSYPVLAPVAPLEPVVPFTTPAQFGQFLEDALRRLPAADWAETGEARQVTVWVPHRTASGRDAAGGNPAAQPQLWENGSKLLIWTEIDDNIIAFLRKNSKIR